MEPAFNRDELMDRIDGDLEFMQEILEMFDEDVPRLLDGVRDAVAAREAAALVTSAHTLKGLLSNFCAGAAELAVRTLEVRGRENQFDDADVLVRTLDEETARLRAELQVFLEAQIK